MRIPYQRRGGVEATKGGVCVDTSGTGVIDTFRVGLYGADWLLTLLMVNAGLEAGTAASKSRATPSREQPWA